MNVININGREIEKNHPPYIIAEMSANHNGSLERAIQIIKAAKDSGADAIKLQTFTAESITLDIDHPRFRLSGKSPWAGERLFDLYAKAAMPWGWHKQLLDYGKEIGITIFSSPFDAAAVELLESLEVPAYKIASFELVDLDLVRLCASTGKPLIMSTGMASLVEISEAVQAARDAGCKDLVLLKCTSAYPALPETINLRTLPHLAKAFDVIVGLSDHTMGIGVSVAATALGAAVIEKHFTLSRTDGGLDSSFSLEPSELILLVEETRKAHAALGCVTYAQGDSETSFKSLRRSLFFVRDLPKGSRIGRDDVRSLRPGDGISPKFLQNILGHTLKKEVVRGTPVSWDIFT
jgi:N-acetylneuraminate synthase